MQRIEPKLTPSVILIIDDDDQRARAVGDVLRKAFGRTSIRIRRWDEPAAGARDSLVDLAILTPRDHSAEAEDHSLPHALAELKHVPTLVLASPSDPQSAVNAVLDGASDALIMQERYLDLLATRVSRTLARAHFRADSDRRRSTASTALQRSRDENRRLRTRLSTLHIAAMLDPLTGLPNRRALDSRLAELWDTAVLTSGELSCLVIDVDYFKRVNDTLGHAAGDLVLCVLARVLTEQCRQDDIAARIGGDEFVALLPLATAQQAELVAQRIQAAFDRAVHHALTQSHALTPGTTACPTISIGVSSRTTNRPTCAADLLAHADIALYAGKHQGRNHIRLAAEIGCPTRRLASAG